MVTPLLATLLPAHTPCEQFHGTCTEMRWSPADGHVPRGFCGALGDVAEVELVLVAAEPGDPLRGESHNDFSSTVAHSLSCLRFPPTPFHQNVRLILNMCYPNQSLDEQLRRVWRTNAVLCSAKVECGRVPRSVERTCVSLYLSQQLALVPHALVAALGTKAQRRLRQEGIRYFPAAHPSSRKSTKEKHASWRALAKALTVTSTV